MTPESARPWIRTLRPDARLRLICLPYAGGGTVDFRSWQEHFPSQIDVCPVILPGRETRLSEPPHRDMKRLVQALVDGMGPVFRQAPFALFGHSMGAWVAFELARALRRAGLPEPVHLFVSARAAPHVQDRLPHLSELSDDAFVLAMQERYRAIPEAILAQPRILRIFLPALRADIEVLETYRHEDEPPLQVPLTAFAGTADPVVAPADVALWRAHTTGPFTFRRLPGGHFFLRDQQDLLCDAIAGPLGRLVR